MRGVESTASLGDDVDGPLHRQTMTGGPDQLAQRHSRQHGHNEERLEAAFEFELADVDDLDDVGMIDVGQDFVFTVEKLERAGIGDVQQSLDGDVAPQDGIKGLIDYSHPTPAQDFLDLITPFENRGSVHVRLPCRSSASRRASPFPEGARREMGGRFGAPRLTQTATRIKQV